MFFFFPIIIDQGKRVRIFFFFFSLGPTFLFLLNGENEEKNMEGRRMYHFTPNHIFPFSFTFHLLINY